MDNIIEVRNLTKHFGSVKAIDGISLSVAKGEIFGFLGPNGAGKTTTIRCLMDFIRPTSGQIKILNQFGTEVRHKIGYLSGQVHLYDKWTGQMHFDFFSRLNGDKNISRELAKRLEFDPRIKTKKLSSGNRQKLGLILALMHQPEVLIWDEPTNALDPLLQNEVYKLLQESKNKGVTIFMSSHNLNEVEKVCDRVGVIKEGKIVAEESVATLKNKRLYSLRATFMNLVDSKRLAVPGLHIKGWSNNSVDLSFKGEINKLIDHLQSFNLVDLEIRRASLEDIFLEFYQ